MAGRRREDGAGGDRGLRGRLFRPVRIIVVAAFSLCALTYLLLPPLSRSEAVRRQIERWARSSSGYHVEIGSFSIAYDLSITIDGLSVGVAGQAPFFSTEQARVRWSLSALSGGRIGAFILIRPHLYSGRLPRREGNGDGEGDGDGVLPLMTLELREGMIHYETAGRELTAGPISLTIDSLRGTRRIELSGSSELAEGEAELQWFAVVGPDLQRVWGEARFDAPDLGALWQELGDDAGEETAADRSLAERLLDDVSGAVQLRFHGDLRNRLMARIRGRTRGDVGVPWMKLGGYASFTLAGDGWAQLALRVDPAVPVLPLSARLARSEGERRLVLEADWRRVDLRPLLAWRPQALPARIDGVVDLSLRAEGVPSDLQWSGALGSRRLVYETESWSASAALRVPFAWQDSAIAIHAPGLRLRDLKASMGGFEGTVGEASAEGRIELGSDMTRLSARISLGRAGFHDPEYLRVAEGLAIRGSIGLQFSSATAAELELDLAAPAGELLWDRVYVPLEPNPVRVRGGLARAGEELRLRDLELTATGIGALRAGGVIGPGGDRALHTSFDVAGLERLFSLAVEEPLAESYRFLRGSEVRGHLTGVIDYASRGGERRIRGRVELADGHVLTSEPSVEIAGLGVDLPFELGEAASGEDTPMIGLLHFGHAVLGGVEVPQTAFTLLAGPNRFALSQPVPVGVLGGTLMLSQLSAESLFSEPRIAASVALIGLDVSQLASAMGWPAMQGSVEGAIPEITMTEGSIRSVGEILIQIFGGRLQVRDLEIEQVFSAVPTLKLGADFEGISLRGLTEAFEVGQISGIVRGGIRDLAIVNGQPMRFEAWIESVPTRGVPQRISVRAIHQLSILGGAGGDPLTSGILSFFDEYRYAKLGFWCRLRNDRFVLEGVEEHEGKEYLVVGSLLPPRVNVVSHTQVISFSEMVRRLERITAQKGTEDEQSGGE